MSKCFVDVLTLSIIFCILKLNNVAIHGSTLTFKAGNYSFNPKYFQHFNLSIINNALNMDMIIKKEITTGFKTKLDFQISLSQTKNYQSVFSQSMDACALVSSYRLTIFKRWFNSMLKHGNFMYNCPVTPAHYYLKNWKMPSDLVPSYLLAGDYRVRACFFYGKMRSKDFVLDFTVYAELK